MKKRVFCLLLALALALPLFGCSQEPEEEGYPVDPGFLYGMDYIAYEGIGNGIDYVKAFQLMDNMGVQSIRHWMHVTWFFDEDFNVIQGNVDTMKEILAEAQKYDFQIIGMSHRNINKYGYSHQNDKVSRDSPYYQEWIANYERGWYELVKLFPEITIWEIDNETNNTDFMRNAEGGPAFSLQEMADISTDMFFYGSRGIHRANPDAVTVMGGFVTWSAEGFLKKVYDNIKSGGFGEGSTDPDDYFQCLAWHPYTNGFNETSFINQQQALYDIAYSYEGKHKKVYFTELGNWTYTQNNEQVAADYVKQVYAVTAEKLPWVESIHYYRAFDNIIDNNCQGGLFADPNPDRVDVNPITGERRNPGAPKPAALAYQQMTGGEGPLDLLETKLGA